MSEYPVVVDMGTIWPTALASGVHGVLALLQAGLAVYLLVTGVRRLGVPGARVKAAARVGLALLLVAPLAVGAPFAVSVGACLAALLLLRRVEREDAPGRLHRATRAGALVGAAVLAAFTLWEREDALALGVEITAMTREWRAHEVEWQQQADATAPKLGELAPDFELQDPTGQTSVRLADFRGKRPVALIFGSYT